MLDAAQIHFRELQLADVPLLHAWLNKDFVSQWYGKRKPSYAEVVEKYSVYIQRQKPIRSFLILYKETPIGYIQTYRIKDYPDSSKCLQVDEDAAGVDLFIGEAQYLHKGLGSSLLRKFLGEVVFADKRLVSCIIGPEVNNRGAIKAYEKAGFQYLKTLHCPGEEEPEYLLRITRTELLSNL